VTGTRPANAALVDQQATFLALSIMAWGSHQFRIRIIPRQPTHQTIALHAGVSVSTVDRVMNQRGSVADDKFRRVLAAARSLGVEQLRLPEPWRATRRVEVVTPRNPTPFWMMLNRSLEEQILQLPRHYMVQRVQLPQDSPPLEAGDRASRGSAPCLADRGGFRSGHSALAEPVPRAGKSWSA
jgi:hypothetical protein